MISLVASEKAYLLACKTEDDYQGWLSALTVNMGLPACPPPEKNGKMKKNKMTNQLVDTAANFGASRKIMKEFVTEDTVAIVNAMKSFITEYDCEEKANQLETLVFQIGGKVGLLYKEKKVSRDYFLSCIEPLHKCCDKVIDGYEIPFSFSAEELIQSLQEVYAILEKLLKPHLNSKTMKSLLDIFLYFQDEELLNDFFEKRKWKECATVGETLRHLWDHGMV